MIQNSWFSERVYMNTEPMQSLNGMEEMSFIESYRPTTGLRQQSLRITPNSMFRFSNGYTEYTPASSSIPCQWRVLYAAWRLAIPSPNLQAILAFPPKGEPYILRMDWPSLSLRQKDNLLSIASTTYISANKYSKDSRQATLQRNYDSST